VNLVWVTVAALVTALATGLGALPFLVMRRPGTHTVGIANAVAAGFMLSATGALALEGLSKGWPRALVGATAGALTVMLAHHAIPRKENLIVGALRGADARTAVLIVAVMTVHSFSEGVGLGVSYAGGDDLGVFITAAIAVHNIPEGLAISLVLVPRGATVLAASAGACSPRCRSPSWPHRHSRSSNRSRVSSRSGSASPPAQWLGWFSRS